MPAIQVGYSSADLTGKYWPLESVQTSAATGQSDDFTVNDTTSVLVMSGAAPVVTGFTGGRAGRILFIIYTGSGTLTINHQDSASTAANRVVAPDTAAFSIIPNSRILMVYDGTASRWRTCTFPDKTMDETITGTWVMSGGVNFADAVVSRPELKDYSETKTAPTISGGTLTLDYSLGQVFEVVVSANITTLTISNWPPTGKKGTIEVWFKGNGSAFTQAWGSIRWPGDSAPTLTTTTGDYTVITFHTFDAGTTVFGCAAASAW